MMSVYNKAMIRLMPDFGGKELPEDDKTWEAEQDSKWGREICQLLAGILGKTEAVDFVDDKGTALFRVKKVGTDQYALWDFVEKKGYAINHLGEPYILNLEGSPDLDKKQLQVKLMDDIKKLPYLDNKKVKDM